jgi:hypothetical protein
MISVSSGLQPKIAELFRSSMLSLFEPGEKLFLLENAFNEEKYFTFAPGADFDYHFVSRVKR